MFSFFLIITIFCKSVLNNKLSLNLNFFYKITSIFLLFSTLINYKTLLISDIVTEIGIYNGLFHITYITQTLEIFLLIIGSIILISLPIKIGSLIEFWKTSNVNVVSLSSVADYNNTIRAVSKGFQPFTFFFESSDYKKLETSNKVSLLFKIKNLLQPNTKYIGYYDNIFIGDLSSLALAHGSVASEGMEGTSSVSNENSLSLNYFILSNNNFINYAINYSIIVLFCILGASLLISCSDLISMYLSIELQSFSLYVLSTLYKDSELSTSAGLKYFLLGGLSSCLILFGAGIIYAYTGLTNFESIYSFLSIYSIEINNNLVQIIYPFISSEYSSSIFLGFIFIFVGFLFKISAAPFHNWSPDVYDDTPTIVTIWLTLIPKISILILLLELHIHIDLIDQLTQFGQLNLFSLNIDTITKNLLLISSLLSLIIGSVVGLAQNRIKRLLAYSTISHIGYILLALGIYTEQSIDSFIFYIIQYIITNLNIFLIILAFGYIINNSINKETTDFEDKDIRYISEFKGQFYLNPSISLCFSICLFSIAGIPPLMGFFSKQFVLYSAIQSGYNFIALVAIFVSVISASYYLKIIKTFFIDLNSPSSLSLNGGKDSFKEREGDLRDKDLMQKQSNSIILGYSSRLKSSHSFLISTLTLSILFFIFKPSLILNITQLLSLSLFYI